MSCTFQVALSETAAFWMLVAILVVALLSLLVGCSSAMMNQRRIRRVFGHSEQAVKSLAATIDQIEGGTETRKSS